MEILYDETYASSDGSQTSRNIWFGYADITVDGEHSKLIMLSDEFMDELCKTTKGSFKAGPTETNWYFYASTVTKDAIGDSIRPSIMIRERDGKYIVHFNFSDYDFALNIDAILMYKAGLEKRLND